MTRDHTVPQMYLRRFGRQRKPGSRQWSISARRVDQVDHSFTTNIGNVAAVTDFYGVGVEKLLCQIEGDAVAAFDTILEDSHGALPGPDRWPLGEDERAAMAWWIAAQIVRTVRQRRRLQHLTKEGTEGDANDQADDGADRMAMPQSIRSLAGRDKHVKFMANELARLSWAIVDQPWGLGFSDMCLWTSDVPVVIVNGQDDENQLLATSYWEVILPLDPHRFLLLPGWRAQEDDPGKQVDHLIKLDGGFGQTLNLMIFEAADTQLFCHEDHDPFPDMTLDGHRLATPWTGDTNQSSSWMIEYTAMDPGFTVERRWLTEHPPRRNPSPAAPAR